MVGNVRPIHLLRSVRGTVEGRRESVVETISHKVWMVQDQTLSPEMLEEHAHWLNVQTASIMQIAKSFADG
jgi:hypothetical protein